MSSVSLKILSILHNAQARKQASEGMHPDFETQGRHHLESKIGVSVAPQKGLMSPKNFKKRYTVQSLQNILTKPTKKRALPVKETIFLFKYLLRHITF